MIIINNNIMNINKEFFTELDRMLCLNLSREIGNDFDNTYNDELFHNLQDKLYDNPLTSF
jgi:hypothetical protein